MNEMYLELKDATFDKEDGLWNVPDGDGGFDTFTKLYTAEEITEKLWLAKGWEFRKRGI